MTLQPCGAKTGTAELTACLTLVAPTGMTEAERQAWIAVARHELSGMPADLLKLGCAHARKVADHPSKVLPAIFKAVGARWEDRKRHAAKLAQDAEELARARLPAPERPPIPREETQAIIREACKSLTDGASDNGN